MNLEFFIARKILGKDKTVFKMPVVGISVFSIALSLAVMIIAVAVVTGFKNQITEKVTGFGSHIVISNYDFNSSYEVSPIEKNNSFCPILKKTKGIKHIQAYGIKAGVIKTSDQIQGIVLKGVGSDFDWTFFKKRLVAGRIFHVNDSVTTNEILISRAMADKLKLKLNDKLDMYFIQDPPRVRRFTISGIYETGLEQFDNLYLIADIGHIQKLNNWTKHQVAGFEVQIDDFKDLDKMGKLVYQSIDSHLKSQTIKEIYPQLFDWLELVDVNALVILLLMVAVSGITMISTLLILILEKTNMIGILKALGTRNISIQKIFVYNTAYIVGKGLFWGNLIALSICFIQLKFGLIKLNQASYFISEVPININLIHLLLINAGTFVIGFLMLIIPSFIISKISPVKAIRFN